MEETSIHRAPCSSMSTSAQARRAGSQDAGSASADYCSQFKTACFWNSAPSAVSGRDRNLQRPVLEPIGSGTGLPDGPQQVCCEFVWAVG